MDNIKCPVCKSASKEAKNNSLKNIVKDDLKHLIVNESYYFCNNNLCEVVFFNKEYEKIFLLEDIDLMADFSKQSGCGCNKGEKDCKSKKGCCGH